MSDIVWCEGDNIVIRARKDTRTFTYTEARELFTNLGIAIAAQEAARSKRPLESPTLENLLTHPGIESPRSAQTRKCKFVYSCFEHEFASRPRRA